VWVQVPRAQLGAPGDEDVFPDDTLSARKLVQEQYMRYLDALRANDAAAIVDVLHDKCASAVRDYVAGSGTLVELTGKAAHRSWYQALLDAFTVIKVEPLYLVTEDWYVFAELRITARSGSKTVAFHTAEFHIPAKDGRFIARIGHGTDPA
jgi:hypothetical protein